MRTAFGPIFQLGYVVSDLDRALEHWLACGVGPWYVIDTFPAERFCYRGGPSILPDISIALSYSGGLQVELIHQRDDTPTLYRDFLASSGEGLQHLGYLPVDYDGTVATALTEGWEVAHDGSAAGGTRFVYLDRGGPAGTIAELVDLDPRSAGFFSHIHDEADNWDGHTDPIRPVGRNR